MRLVETVPDHRGSGGLLDGTTRGTEGREGSDARGCWVGAERARSAALKIGFREGSAGLALGGVLVGALGRCVGRDGSDARGRLGSDALGWAEGCDCLARSAALWIGLREGSDARVAVGAGALGLGAGALARGSDLEGCEGRDGAALGCEGGCDCLARSAARKIGFLDFSSGPASAAGEPAKKAKASAEKSAVCLCIFDIPSWTDAGAVCSGRSFCRVRAASSGGFTRDDPFCACEPRGWILTASP